MENRNGFNGLGGFIWWVGVVESRVDPLRTGRYQVRIFGWHTDNKSQLPTKDLPWAHPVHSVNNPKAFSPLDIGDWVVGFFMDGESAQFPVVFGVMPGMKK